MAHFALLDLNSVVTEVIVVDNSVLLNDDNVEQETLGIAYCNEVVQQGNWIQTSYNGNFRGCFAGIGYTYDPASDTFVAPEQPVVDAAQISPNA